MGNCLTCFKEPPATALETPSNHHKEEMCGEAQLYPAPSHTAASAPPDVLPVNNSNPLVTPAEAVTAAPITRFYPKRGHSKSAPIMGLSDSKPSEGKMTALFELYRDEVEDCILAEGIEQFCKDLQISPTDLKILILAWKLGAEQMCRFTRPEFLSGLKSIRADSLKSIQNRLPELVTEIENNPDQFKDLYRFTFRFGLDSAAGERLLPTDNAVKLWRVVFSTRQPPILGRWLTFLERHHQSVRGIQRDTWNMFLNFAEAVGDDLSCYDDTEAWPSLFDDFVEWENDQANQNVTKGGGGDGQSVEIETIQGD